MEIVRNRQSTPESTQPQPTPVATAPQDSRQNLLPDCKLPENVQESPSPNLNECYNEDLFAEVKQLRTTLIDFSFKAEGQNISLEESFANIQGGQLGYFRNNGDLQTLISHPNHPYNFLIPGIEEGATTYVAPRQEARAKFIPKEYGIEYFLNNPYFEPKDVNSLFPLPLEENNYLKPKTAITPVRFGPNSLRHEIATAVAKGLEELAQPGVEETKMPRPRWFSPRREQDRHEITFYGEEQPFTLKDYITTTLWASKGITRLEVVDNSEIYNYRTPRVSWEFIHPKLPIVQVTTWNKTNLPLKQTGINEEDCPKRGGQPQCGVTSYAVTFVVAFQNRWDSFEDSKRWVNQFEDSFEEIFGDDPADYKNRWHHTDFTHYGLIGPVEIEVFASEVLQTEKAPSITIDKTWPQQCGAELFDEIRLEHFSKQNLSNAERLVTPGFPLPGEVLHYKDTEPGTEAWNNLDQGGKLVEYLSNCKPSDR